MVWTLALWLVGWAALPVARRLFVNLPDGGLAAGRLAFVVAVALVVFWGASLHLAPLSLAPALAALLALLSASGWRDKKTREWARLHWKSLLCSDAIFLLSWGAFLGLRLLHPEINDLEKSMDVALLSAAWKADWLPFSHPWWGGAQFTNYYYFGPLMGALMGRALGNAPHVAYNLVQPAFCAFFLSSLWALGAALTRSKAWGVVAMLLVGLSGTLEPLRQWSEKGWMWPFDWWTTARVIPDTINEYPAFTMAIGDAHAHFYALSFAALWLSLAWSLFATDDAVATETPAAETPATSMATATASDRRKAKARDKAKTRAQTKLTPALVASAPRRRIVIVGGLILGAWLMTNTWDAPIFGLLFAAAIWWTRPPLPAPKATKTDEKANDATKTDATKTDATAKSGLARLPWRVCGAWGALFGVAIVAALPYLRLFRSPVGGAKFEPWMPDPFSFALLWGGWIVLGAFAFLLPALPDAPERDAPERDVQSARFRRLLIGVGLLALAAPFFFYIKGAFGDGPYRHQDTVFKFGLQAWILLGVGISAELGARLLRLAAVPKFAVSCALLLAAPVLSLAPATTIWTRAITQGTVFDESGAPSRGIASLDGMRYLPLAEERALRWLQIHGRAGEIVMEGVPLNADGLPGGDYEPQWGRVGAFSGLSSTLGWPQHVWGWSGDVAEVAARGQRVAALYALGSPLATARGASDLGARYTFFGQDESGGNWPAPEAARAAGFAPHYFQGDDGSRALILERIGR